MPGLTKQPMSVSAADLANLHKSGLRDETIRLARLRTANGALEFPYFDLNGKVNCFARRRPHVPRKGKDGKPIKYEQPAGSPVRAYLAPATLPKLRDGKSAVYITEGEKKALALSQIGLPAIGLGGVWSACKPGTTELIDDLASINWVNREAFIVFDADDKPKTRQNVDKARRRLAGALRRAGAKAHHVHLPAGDCKGVDDYLVKHGADAFKELVARTMNKAAATRFTAAQLMAMDLPEPHCVVPGIVAEGCNLLVSRPKLGKSWFAYDLAIAIASGGKFLGHEIEQGDVLYLALEDNKRRLKNRLAKLLGDAPPPERLTLATAWPRMDEGGIEEIQKWIDAADDPRLVIVDTLAKVKKRATGQSNAYADDYADIGQLKELADENEFAMLLIHHVRKAPSDDILDDVSGTIGITGAADTILLLKRERGQHDALLHVTGRDVDEREIGLKWDGQACKWSVLGPADQLRLSGQRMTILTTLEKHGPLAPTEIADLLGWRVNNAKQLLHQMQKVGQVKSVDGKYQARSDNPDNRNNPLTRPGEDQ